MSGIIKNALKRSFLATTRSLLRPGLCLERARSQYARSLWHMSSRLDNSQRFNNLSKSSTKCSCGGRCAGLHTADVSPQNKASAPELAQKLTQGEKELAEFLTDEIASEKKLQKEKKLPQELNGFTVKIDGSEVTMKKESGNELVEISFNVNHSVDSEGDTEVEPSSDKPDVAEMKSKPNFEVEVKRGNKTVGFTCSIVGTQSQQQSQEYNDLFVIDEVVVYDGEWKDSNYSVAGEVIDGTLYDLLMNFLEDKGVSNDLVEKLVDLSTAYEHSCYIALLEDLHKFSKGD